MDTTPSPTETALSDMAEVFGTHDPSVTIEMVRLAYSKERQRGLTTERALDAVRRALQLRCFPMKNRSILVYPDDPVV